MCDLAAHVSTGVSAAVAHRTHPETCEAAGHARRPRCVAGQSAVDLKNGSASGTKKTGTALSRAIPFSTHLVRHTHSHSAKGQLGSAVY